MGRVLNDPVELRVASELLNVGARNGVAEERLGEEDDEGYSVLARIFGEYIAKVIFTYAFGIVCSFGGGGRGTDWQE